MAVIGTFFPGIAGTFTYNGVQYTDQNGFKLSVTASNPYGSFTAKFELSTPVASGYSISGWTTTEGSNIPQYSVTPVNYSLGDNYSPFVTYYASFYACWNYIITFDANGGSSGPTTQIYNPNSSSSSDNSLTEVIPIKNGYKFLGWSKSSTALAPEYQPGKLYSFSGPTTLYAVWTPDLYSLTFFSNGGNFESGATSFVKTYPTNTVLNLIDFNTDDPLIKNRKGYKFIGWNTNAVAKEGLEQYIVTSSNLQSLYAIWELSSNVYIYTNNSWKIAVPYVYKDGTWKTAQSKIYNGEWRQ